MSWREVLGEPTEPTGPSSAGLADVERAFAGPLPADHAAFLADPAGFRGPLLGPDGAPGREVVLFGADELLAETAYAVFAERDLGDAVPVGGQDAWRWALRRTVTGTEYVEVDLGTGDVVATYGPGLEAFLRALAVEHDGA